MPVDISATFSSTLVDTDADGVADPGEVLHNTIRVVNNGDTDALNVTVTDPLNGSTIDAGSVQITPVAVGDAFDITGNTPITVKGRSKPMICCFFCEATSVCVIVFLSIGQTGSRPPLAIRALRRSLSNFRSISWATRSASLTRSSPQGTGSARRQSAR